MGDTISKGTLTRRYGHYWPSLLSDHVRLLARERGKPRRYEVVRPLPSAAEYAEMVRGQFMRPVKEALEEALAEVGNLAEELEAWYDSLPDGLQGTAKADEIAEAADRLAEVATEVEEVFRTLESPAGSILVLPPSGSSRPARARWAAEVLREVAERTGLADDLEPLAEELEEVEFPGMY